MNPGGDYGKKELSPALSNRFTQIWVPGIEDGEELAAIVQSHLTGECCDCQLVLLLHRTRPECNSRPAILALLMQVEPLRMCTGVK